MEGTIIRNFRDGVRVRVGMDDAQHPKGFVSHSGTATRLRAIAVTVQRVLRCCVTRRTGTLQQRRSHHLGFG